MSLVIYGTHYASRLLLGSAGYPTLQSLLHSIENSKVDMVTVGLRRQQSNALGGQSFWQQLRELKITLLPNTAGCESVFEAEQLAEMSRELFDTPLIKLEVIGDPYTLQPDPIATITAAQRLIKKGFHVLPYCTDDLVICQRLVDAGCEVIMPWGAPIGTGRGLLNPYQFSVLRQRLPDVTLIVDAGLGKPSHACQAMELGADAVLVNTAVAKAQQPVAMAEAFAAAVLAGHGAYRSGLMIEQQRAQPSTPVLGMPFRG